MSSRAARRPSSRPCAWPARARFGASGVDVCGLARRAAAWMRSRSDSASASSGTSAARSTRRGDAMRASPFALPQQEGHAFGSFRRLGGRALRRRAGVQRSGSRATSDVRQRARHQSKRPAPWPRRPRERSGPRRQRGEQHGQAAGCATSVPPDRRRRCAGTAPRCAAASASIGSAQQRLQEAARRARHVLRRAAHRRSTGEQHGAHSNAPTLALPNTISSASGSASQAGAASSASQSSERAASRRGCEQAVRHHGPLRRLAGGALALAGVRPRRQTARASAPVEVSVAHERSQRDAARPCGRWLRCRGRRSGAAVRRSAAATRAPARALGFGPCAGATTTRRRRPAPARRMALPTISGIAARLAAAMHCVLRVDRPCGRRRAWPRPGTARR